MYMQSRKRLPGYPCRVSANVLSLVGSIFPPLSLFLCDSISPTGVVTSMFFHLRCGVEFCFATRERALCEISTTVALPEHWHCGRRSRFTSGDRAPLSATLLRSSL